MIYIILYYIVFYYIILYYIILYYIIIYYNYIILYYIILYYYYIILYYIILCYRCGQNSLDPLRSSKHCRTIFQANPSSFSRTMLPHDGDIRHIWIHQMLMKCFSSQFLFIVFKAK